MPLKYPALFAVLRDDKGAALRHVGACPNWPSYIVEGEGSPMRSTDILAEHAEASIEAAHDAGQAPPVAIKARDASELIATLKDRLPGAKVEGKTLDVAEPKSGAARPSISIKRSALRRIDREAKARRMTRSDYLAWAAQELPARLALEDRRERDALAAIGDRIAVCLWQVGGSFVATVPDVPEVREEAADMGAVVEAARRALAHAPLPSSRIAPADAFAMNAEGLGVVFVDPVQAVPEFEEEDDEYEHV